MFGLKAAQYDYHMAVLGGTLITLEGDDLTPQHVPALVKYAPFPVICESSEIFLLTKNKIIIKIKRRYELFVAPF